MESPTCHLLSIEPFNVWHHESWDKQSAEPACCRARGLSITARGGCRDGVWKYPGHVVCYYLYVLNELPHTSACRRLRGLSGNQTQLPGGTHVLLTVFINTETRVWGGCGLSVCVCVTCVYAFICMCVYVCVCVYARVHACVCV